MQFRQGAAGREAGYQSGSDVDCVRRLWRTGRAGRNASTKLSTAAMAVGLAVSAMLAAVGAAGAEGKGQSTWELEASVRTGARDSKPWMKRLYVKAEDCRDFCLRTKGCTAWVYRTQAAGRWALHCFLSNGPAANVWRRPLPNTISGLITDNAPVPSASASSRPAQSAVPPSAPVLSLPSRRVTNLDPELSRQCANEKLDDRATIRGCTSVIESGRLSGRDLAVAHYNRAIAYGKLRQVEREVADLERAIEIDPSDFSGAYHNLGVIYEVSFQDNRRALHYYNEAVRRKPDNIVSRISRAKILLVLNQYKDAIMDFDLVLERMPQNIGALYMRGIARRRLGNLQAGNADIAQAKRIRPDIAEIFARRGVKP